MIVRAVFGKSFGGAVPILQILAVIPFIISLTDAIGFQSLLPAGKESVLTKAIVAGGLVNLSLAFLFAPRFQATGMAISVIIAEAAVCGILVCIVARTTMLFRRRGLDQADAVSLTPALIDVTTRTSK
jgi:polysaccharide transporter, PST family